LHHLITEDTITYAENKHSNGQNSEISISNKIFFLNYGFTQTLTAQIVSEKYYKAAKTLTNKLLL
jgi:hypothetical protein